MSTLHFNKASRSDAKIACPCCGAGDLKSELYTLLELIRHHFNAAVIINSGFRCEKHNKEIDGAKASKHLTGEAADIRVSGVSPQDVYDFVDRVFPNSYGLGLHRTFLHVDVRPYKWRETYAN